MRRIVVIGVAGSGKSTVARELSERLGVPHIELDSIFWQPNWTKLDDDEFEARVTAVTASGGWIADGNYSDRIRRITWGAADTVVWLDQSRRLIMWQVIRRTIRRTTSGVELWNGNHERPLRDQLSRDPSKSIPLWAWRTYTPTKRQYGEAMDDPQFSHVRFVRLKTRRQIKQFLRSVHQ
ncbi:AAA family ATPase [Kribbella sp. NPDC051586]|uniref:AAA family ATPase n=1 Tax=Kribbella sp. NPDC051586 TaxID=3364118 RepID=UPI0037B84A80